jgi:nucleotide-binding universal stress UspA family protein
MESQLIVGGNVVDALHSIVDRDSPDLIVMTAHGYTGSDNRPFGSMALNFVVYGINPLLIVQDNPESCGSLPSPSDLATVEKSGH